MDCYFFTNDEEFISRSIRSDCSSNISNDTGVDGSTKSLIGGDGDDQSLFDIYVGLLLLEIGLVGEHGLYTVNSEVSTLF